MKKLFGNGKVFALCRAGLALVIAAALVIVSGFAFVYQFKGPAEVSTGGELKDQRYVKTDVKYVMDVCGEEVDSFGNTLYYYVISPVGNRFVLMRFGAGMIDELTALEAETMDYLTGTSMVMSMHLPVRGMVEKAQPGAYSLLSEWFNGNIEWMSLAGVVGADASAAEYLSNELICVDQVGAFGYGVSLLLTVLAGLFLLYMIGELVLIGIGFYRESEVTARRTKRRRARKEKEKKAAKAARAAEKKAEAKKKAEAEKKVKTEKKSEPEKTAKKFVITKRVAQTKKAEKKARPVSVDAPAEEEKEQTVAQILVENTINGGLKETSDD